MQVLGLTSLNICSSHTGDLGEPMVLFRPNAGRLKSKIQPMFQFKYKSRNEPLS